MVGSQLVDAQTHDDKYNDPRVKVTRRGLLLGVGVIVFAVIGAAWSIWARSTRLEKTTEFFGAETIAALQLAERVQLLPRGESKLEQVELTATPGLGYLRHALLDERHYLWDTVTDRPVSELCASEGAFCVALRLTDPTAQRFPETLIDLELRGGWVGLARGGRRVQVTERVQPALQHYLQTLMHVEQRRYGVRK